MTFWLEASLFLVEVKLEMFKTPVPTKCGRGLPNFAPIAPGVPVREARVGAPASVILSHSLKAMLLQVPPEDDLGVSFLLMEGGRSLYWWPRPRAQDRQFSKGTHMPGEKFCPCH